MSRQLLPSPHIVCLTILLLTLFTHMPQTADGQTASDISLLSADDLQGDKSIELNKLSWKYHAGDDATWVRTDFDDSSWETLGDTDLGITNLPRGGWNGRAWFRLRVAVDERLVNQPLALRVWHWGASEIYLDGKLIAAFGRIESDEDEEHNPRGLFVPVVFTSAESHTIAMRYSFKAASDVTQGRGAWLARGNHAPGFSLTFVSGKDAAFNLDRRARADRLEYVFIGLLASLALVHFLLYLFYPRERGNLFYSFFVAALCAVIWLSRLTNTGNFDATTLLLADTVRNDLQGAGVMSLLAFLYVEFLGRVSRFFWLLLTLWFIVFLLHLAQIVPLGSFFFTPVMLSITLADCLRIMAQALTAQREGSWIIAAGITVFFVLVANNIVLQNNFVAAPAWLSQLSITATILTIPLAVSIYLARNFARTNRNLEAQLTQVQELSARQLEHERTEAELRLQHEKERSENERRARELEEARGLQLSMLPKQVPQVPDLEIAAYMNPATEVGGDYYDFHLGEDGTLTVAIGDADRTRVESRYGRHRDEKFIQRFCRRAEHPALLYANINRAQEHEHALALYVNGTNQNQRRAAHYWRRRDAARAPVSPCNC